MKRHNIKQQGFTLTELMIVVALAAVFATFAVPSMGSMIARQRVQGQTNEIANAFTFAHSEAVRRGKPVFIVPGSIKSDGKLNGPAQSWSAANALLVFTDNGADNQTYQSGEDLRVVPISTQLHLPSVSEETLGSSPSAKHDDKLAFVYYSNGQMRMKRDGTALRPPGGIARIVVKDKKRATKNQTTRFCDVVRIDATGRASVFTGKRSTLRSNDFFYCNN